MTQGVQCNGAAWLKECSVMEQRDSRSAVCNVSSVGHGSCVVLCWSSVAPHGSGVVRSMRDCSKEVYSVHGARGLKAQTTRVVCVLFLCLSAVVSMVVCVMAQRGSRSGSVRGRWLRSVGLRVSSSVESGV